MQWRGITSTGQILINQWTGVPLNITTLEPEKSLVSVLM